jgi:hypothetical protein
VLCASVLAFRPADAFEGVPPLHWLPSGRSLPALGSAVLLGAEWGGGGGFAGDGPGHRALLAQRWLYLTATGRYGFLDDLEGFLGGPVAWVLSPQEYVNVRTGGAPQVSRATLTGTDGGDPWAGLRWRVLGHGDPEGWEASVAVGAGLPLGTNPWQNIRFNYVTGPSEPSLPAGDGAWKLLVSAAAHWAGGAWEGEAAAGWRYRFPVEATAMEPPGSVITVTPPASAVGRFRAARSVGLGLRALAGAEGHWTGGGDIKTEGLIVRDPAALDAILDSYRNLLRESVGIWTVVGASVEVGRTEAVLEVAAPAATARAWRAWRVSLGIVYALPAAGGRAGLERREHASTDGHEAGRARVSAVTFGDSVEGENVTDPKAAVRDLARRLAEPAR